MAARERRVDSHDDRTGRPLSVTLVAVLFILVGAGGILKDVLPLFGTDRARAMRDLITEGAVGLAFIWAVRMLAVVGGWFLLRGGNWARWMLVAWMCFHVAISLMHSALEAFLHLVIFAAASWVLFRRRASAYFAAS